MSRTPVTIAISAAVAALSAYAAWRLLGGRRSSPADLFAEVRSYEGDPRSREQEVVVHQISGRPQRASMGLIPLDLGDWVRIDGAYAARIQERKELLQLAYANVVMKQKGSDEAVRELWALLCRFLVLRYPALFERINGGRGMLNKATGDSWEDIDKVDDPLAAMLVTVPDDFFVLIRHEDTGRYHFDAASVTYAIPPQMVRERAGMSMDGVHGPVPGFKRRVLAPVDKWFSVFARPAFRANWNLTDSGDYTRPHAVISNELAHPAGPPPADLADLNALRFTDGTSDSVDFERIHFRIEKQSFIRLPRTGAIVFAVRTHIYHLPWLLEKTAEIEKGKQAGEDDPPPFARRLYSATCRMHEEPGVVEYRSAGPLNAAVRKWMEDNMGMGEKDLVPG